MLKTRSLSLSDTYPCPVCRQGQIEEIVLMDAFACELCRHILSVNLPQQQVQVVDSTQALTWHWNGQRWRLVHGKDVSEMTNLIVVSALLLTIVPATLVWVAGEIFPPLPSASHPPFSHIWAVITLFAHLGFVLWLVSEYYQVSFYLAARMRLLRRRVTRWLQA